MVAPPTLRAWPRWTTLTVLTLAVLGAHLVFLADGLPNWWADTPTPAAPRLSTGSTVITRTIAPETAQPLAPAVQTGQVRLITPPAAQPPVTGEPEPPTATPAPPPPAPKPSPAPTTPPAPPEAASVAVPPIAAPVPAPLEVERPPAVPDDPAPVAAEARDAAPETTASAAVQPADSATEATDTSPQEAASLAAGQSDTSPGPAQPPASAQLSYIVEGQSKGLNYSANGSLDWRNEGSAYTVRMEIRLFLLGSRAQTSQGQLVATGLQPERFADQRRSERAAHFDHTQNRIRFSNNAPDAELLPGAQDRLSVFLQLAGLLNARPEAYAAGQSIAIPVAGTSGSEIWRFQVQGLASVDLPAGSLIARHLVREPREIHDTRVDIWLAPSLGHLPVRIRLTQDNGDVVDQRLSTLP